MKRNRWFILPILLVFLVSTHYSNQYPGLGDGLYAALQTGRGTIILELDFKRAPMTVANFVGLAEGRINNSQMARGTPFYNGTTFHRVVAGHVIQAGSPKDPTSRSLGYTIPNEIHPALRHSGAGMLGMANGGPHTNGSQFYITLGDRSYLDNDYTVFGRVVAGLDVVFRIKQGDTIDKVNIIRRGKEASRFRVATEQLQVYLEKAWENVRRHDLEKKRRETKIISSKWPGARRTPSGLRYLIEKPGIGPATGKGDQISLHYSLQFLDGRQFNSTTSGDPFTYELGKTTLTRGFDEGVSGMRAGEKRVLIVPADLAYGNSGRYEKAEAGKSRRFISPATTVVYRIELIAINKRGPLPGSAHISEGLKSFKTYPFSSPDPMPNIGRIYPYFKFNGFSHRGEPRNWKVVTLENPYIQVDITPEIGGKVWGAIEKASGKEFIYNNEVVKFRNIAMRGPWTSGGIEFNFGAIGHAPTTATPVDYDIFNEADGSVSCVVGALDLPSRTQWRVKINLPKDKAYFETECYWINPTPLHQSLYHWMTAAAVATPDLHFVYPGTHHIGHGGKAHPWPIDEQGRDLSLYGNNDFGPSKSYHILGEYTEFFGGYWKSSDFGYGHWSLYDDKPGKKLWLWSQSRSGQIWEDLLTDPGSGQYIEMQTGLLLNQAAAGSTFSPFKHAYFDPYSTRRWSEFWFPAKGIGDMKTGSKAGSMNSELTGNKLTVSICPTQRIDADLVVSQSGKNVFKKRLKLEPLAVSRIELSLPDPATDYRINLGGDLLNLDSGSEGTGLERPLTIPPQFDWDSAQGLFSAGEELYRQRDRNGALAKLRSCLKIEPTFHPALVMLAELYYRRGEISVALDYARKSLAVNTYDPAGNFIYGLIQQQRGKNSDALDGFGWAAQSPAYRSAAYLACANIHLGLGNLQRSDTYAQRALEYNRYNLSSLEIIAVVKRLQKKNREAVKVLRRIIELDPLSHFARFEEYLLDPARGKLDRFSSKITNELPHESYLELAMTYYNLNLPRDADRVLTAAPPHPTIHLWRAYLNRDREGEVSEKMFNRALESSARLVFPFRSETVPVLEWAMKKSDNWKFKYYLGLILWNNGRLKNARELFGACLNTPDLSTFYLARAGLSAGNAAEAEILKDLDRAVELDPRDWQAWRIRTAHYLRNNQPDRALKNAYSIFNKERNNYILAMDYAKTLLHTGSFTKCAKLLNRTQILPYEGAREGHDLYRQANLFSAIQKLKKKRWAAAIKSVDKARLWPEHLGVGKPYDSDERLEDYIAALCYSGLKQAESAGRMFQLIIDYGRANPGRRGAVLLISALAQRKSGNEAEAERLIREWTASRPEGDILAGWVRATFSGNNEEAEKIVNRTVDAAGRRPWNPTSDGIFPLLLELFN